MKVTFSLRNGGGASLDKSLNNKDP